MPAADDCQTVDETKGWPSFGVSAGDATTLETGLADAGMTVPRRDRRRPPVPQHSKGKRKALRARAPEEIIPTIERMAREAGCSSVSQFLSDMLCLAAERPDLVRELNQEVLPLSA